MVLQFLWSSEFMAWVFLGCLVFDIASDISAIRCGAKLEDFTVGGEAGGLPQMSIGCANEPGKPPLLTDGQEFLYQQVKLHAKVNAIASLGMIISGAILAIRVLSNNI